MIKVFQPGTQYKETNKLAILWQFGIGINLVYKLILKSKAWVDDDSKY